jgi:hypothetical protein
MHHQAALAALAAAAFAPLVQAQGEFARVEEELFG